MEAVLNRPFALVAVAIWYEKDIQGKIWVLLQTRQESGPLNNQLEFPGGKIKAGESSAQAAERESSEELGEELGKLAMFKIYNVQYPDRKVQLHACIGSSQRRIEGPGLVWKELTKEIPENLISGSHPIWSDLFRFFKVINKK